MNLKSSIPAIFLLLIFSSASAQKQQDEDRKRWFLGGNLGLQFGYYTLIDISPIAGYMITDRLAVGAGATYKFYRIREYFYDTYQNRWRHFQSHIYGGPVFSRYFISRPVFAHVEYEYLRFRDEIYVNNPSGQRFDKVYNNVNVHSVFAGGGYRQYFGSGSAFEIMLLWNLNETHRSPYNNPVIRMGVAIGL